MARTRSRQSPRLMMLDVMVEVEVAAAAVERVVAGRVPPPLVGVIILFVSEGKVGSSQRADGTLPCIQSRA